MPCIDDKQNYNLNNWSLSLCNQNRYIYTKLPSTHIFFLNIMSYGKKMMLQNQKLF